MKTRKKFKLKAIEMSNKRDSIKDVAGEKSALKKP